jgi:hypothetical protein
MTSGLQKYSSLSGPLVAPVLQTNGVIFTGIIFNNLGLATNGAEIVSPGTIIWNGPDNGTGSPGTIVWSGLDNDYSTVSAQVAPLPQPAVAVYTGTSLSNLILVASGTGLARFTPDRQMNYFIAVDAKDDAVSDFVLSIVPSPNNDAFTNPLPVPDTSNYLMATASDMRAATSEPGEPFSGSNTGNSLWWTWTPRASGVYYFTDQGYRSPLSVPPRVIAAVYSGTNLNELTLVGRGPAPNLRFPATAKTRYHISLELEDPHAALASPSDGSIILYLARQPIFSFPVILDRDTIQFDLGGSTGQKMRLESSTDLREWVPVRTLQLQSTDYWFREPTDAGDQKYFRAVPSP